VLAEPVLKVVDADGQLAPGRIDDVVPHRLPDFFSNEQVIVTGRFQGMEAMEFRLTGSDGEKQRRFAFKFQPDKTRDSFVPRLWAIRKIAVLTEALRDLGADPAMNGLNGNGIDRNDPRVKELVDEIVRLSTEHGILTEYTAFLAKDGEVFRPQARHNGFARDNYIEKALGKRSGAASANQDMNIWEQKGATSVNPTNRYLNDELVKEEVANVQQAGDKAYYRRGAEWVDAAALQSGIENHATVTNIEVGSAEFNTLVDKLVATKRQGCLSLGRNLELVVDGTRYRIR
jgi:hypothetical protein